MPPILRSATYVVHLPKYGAAAQSTVAKQAR